MSSEAELISNDSPSIMGIDLGTSNSAIAVDIGGIVKVFEVDGRQTCPTAMRVLRSGEIVVGLQAKTARGVDPENTVVSIKREMGSGWEKALPNMPERIFRPEDIGAEILMKLQTVAQNERSWDDKQLRKAIVCIPANFTDPQKVATRRAGELAGLDVIWLLEEPVAAAIAYGWERSVKQTILVYDLGGGTFDVSILEASTVDGAYRFSVKAKEGVQKLGGDDFDFIIVQKAAYALQEISGIDILDDTKDCGINKKKVREAQQKMYAEAERVKIMLSEPGHDEETFIIQDAVTDESGTAHSINFPYTRSEFEDAIRPLLMASIESIDKALLSANMTIDDVDRIILVGGSTRIPLVKYMIKEKLNREPYSDDNPDTVVARGAAIYGTWMMNPIGHEDIVTNIISHNLGVQLGTGKFDCLIKKGEEIPESGALTYSKDYTTQFDDMDQIVIRVFQSPDEVEFVDENCTFVGELAVSVPPNKAGAEIVTVTFSIDKQNLLIVSAVSSLDGRSVDLKVSR